MGFPSYRPVSELTDEEVFGLMQIIYPDLGSDDPTAARIESIERTVDGDLNVICKSSYIDEEEMIPDGPRIGWVDDFFVFDDGGVTAYDFALKGDEALEVKQYLLAKGCNHLLLDNPYIS